MSKPSGELLVGGPERLRRVEPRASGATLGEVPVGSFRLSMNAAGRVIVASRWFAQSGPECWRPVECGFALLNARDLSTRRTVLAAGCHVVRAVASPDGRLVACVLQEVGGPRTHVAAFDAETGRELGRRRATPYPTLAFAPDNRTLLIATSGMMKGEPIEFWTVPDR